MRSMKGFSLIELLIVVAIIAFLSMMAMPSFMRFLAKAKRTEAYVNLRSLYLAEKTYWLERGKYSSALNGTDGLGWHPEGSINYSYGFSGSNVIGSLKAPGSALSPAFASDTAFIIAAAGDIDGDGKLDVLTIDQTGTIKIIQDDLQ